MNRTRIIGGITFAACIVTAVVAGTFDGLERGRLLSSGIYDSHGSAFLTLASA